MWLFNDWIDWFKYFFKNWKSWLNNMVTVKLHFGSVLIVFQHYCYFLPKSILHWSGFRIFRLITVSSENHGMVHQIKKRTDVTAWKKGRAHINHLQRNTYLYHLNLHLSQIRWWNGRNSPGELSLKAINLEINVRTANIII